eukprot:CAMPEP_0196995752 /NCGR_PEP_ID=MMETSP1380-20130617/1810_1 /TAXON_ID=5936 /ORGANISM="Euplotes crassus, Strain CT5" /LENGTH=197 /DNA_ID=CAMNT_0042411529 /DNA_START=377 /DNA_END=969 /DNA_ORIENTATION=+
MEMIPDSDKSNEDPAPEKKKQIVPLKKVKKKARPAKILIDIVKMDTNSDTSSNLSPDFSEKESKLSPDFLAVKQSRFKSETFGMKRPLPEASQGLPQITLGRFDDEEKEMSTDQNPFIGNFTESTNESDNKEEEKLKDEQIHPKMLISLEVQEASLVKKLVNLEKRRMAMEKSKFYNKRNMSSNLEEQEYSSSDDEC